MVIRSYQCWKWMVRTFVNRRVDADYDCDDVKTEMLDILGEQGFSEADTVGMMTAVKTTDAVIKEYDRRFRSSRHYGYGRSRKCSGRIKST